MKNQIEQPKGNNTMVTHKEWSQGSNQYNLCGTLTKHGRTRTAFDGAVTCEKCRAKFSAQEFIGGKFVSGPALAAVFAKDAK